MTGQPETTAAWISRGWGVKCHNIPTWAAYNSLLSAEKPLTEVSVLPLIAAATYEWQTLVTVLKHTEQINCVVVGPNRKTVVTLDMALYERAKQLEMTRDDCKGKWLLRLGVMRMAALRAVGNAHRRQWALRGLKRSWHLWSRHNKANPWSQAHEKSVRSAHDYNPRSLWSLCWRILLISSSPEGPMYHSSSAAWPMMTEFDEKKERQSPLFKFVRTYMRMVLLIYMLDWRVCSDPALTLWNMRKKTWPTSSQGLWCQLRCRKMCATKMTLDSQSVKSLLKSVSTQMRSVSGRECRRSNWKRRNVQGSQWSTSWLT